MKAKLLILIVGLTATLGLPIDDAAEDQWTIIPDADGTFHLVNLEDAKFQAAIIERADFPVKFFLATQSNANGVEIITGNTASLTSSTFSATRPTRIITHGWTDSATSVAPVTIAKAYLARGDYNVIVVDWSVGAASSNYAIAQANVVEAGKKIAAFIDFLKAHGTSLNNIYLVGHSLGAHVSGFAGKYASGKVNTIFGLDAALPMFDINDPSNRLANSDANYVETIHTNAGRLGFDKPIGQSDFYPNWGSAQPGCGTDSGGGCAHSRAYRYFAESLKVDNQFLGLKCGSYNDIEKHSCSGTTTGLMGGDPSNHGVVGLYYVPVNAQAPFATGRV